MQITRLFTKAGDDPLASLKFFKTTSEIKNPDGSLVFRMEDVMVPEGWSQVAIDIIAQKYFRKAGVPKLLSRLDEEGVPEWLQPSVTAEEKLSQLPGLVLPFENYPGNCSYHILPVLLPEGCNRSQFMLDMESRGIQTSMHYPPVHRFQYYQKHFKNTIGSLPVTEEVSGREVTLPLHPLMTLQDVEYVYQAIKEIYQN